MVFTLEQKSLVVYLHNPKDPNASEAARQFKSKTDRSISSNTIRKTWRSNKLSIGPQGGIRYGMSDNEMKEAFEQYDGNVKIAAKNLRYSPGTIRFRWRRLELKFQKR